MFEDDAILVLEGSQVVNNTLVRDVEAEVVLTPQQNIVNVEVVVTPQVSLGGSAVALAIG